MTKKIRTGEHPEGHGDPAVARCLAVGWTLVTTSLAFGLALESFQLVKLPFYLDVRLRRELWTLAHAHGTLLGAVAIVAGLTVERLVPEPANRTLIARLLTWGAVLVPLGFLGGGVANAEGDPSLAIVLVPMGSLLALGGAGLLARAAWAGRPPRT